MPPRLFLGYEAKVISTSINHVVTKETWWTSRRTFHASRLIQSPISGSGSELPPWPQASNPSPYDIFGLERGKGVDPKKIKSLYIKLAKLYHPDSVSALSADIKSERFKKLMAAYEILKDDKKRSVYDYDSRTSSNSGSGNNSGANYGSYTSNYGSSYHTSNYNDSHFYNRGPYEGYEYDARRNMEDEELQKHLHENRLRLVFLVALATLFYGAAQVYRIMKKSEEQTEMAEIETLNAHLSVLRARANYGSGQSQEDRIHRFLRDREEAMYYNQYAKKRQSKDTSVDRAGDVLLSSEEGHLTSLDVDNYSKHE